MTFSVEVDAHNPVALAFCLKELEKHIPNFESWYMDIRISGIDYGTYLNINIDQEIIDVANFPAYGDEDATLEDVFAAIESKEEE